MANEAAHKSQSRGGNASSAAKSAGMIVIFQLLAMALPLASLPVMARALGVELFGQVMLSQVVVFFAVVFVDAGLNGESQRRVVVAHDGLQRAQALLDNLLSRGALAIGLCAPVVLMGWATPGLPLWMVLLSLLQLLGTVMFPQWWFVAREQGFAMGLASALGRLLCTSITLVWVREPQHAWLAVLALSLGSVLSGLMLLPRLRRDLFFYWNELDHSSWRQYLQHMRPMILPGFVASSAQSVPGFVLGAISGSAQVGLYAAADRLTRAGAHVGLIALQSLMNVAARWHLIREQGQTQTGSQRKVLLALTLICFAGAVTIALLAKPLVQLLYGNAFSASAIVLQLLGAWLGLFVLRNACVVLWLTSRGRLQMNAKLQWQEGLSVAALSALGSLWLGAVGVAVALMAVEAGLLVRLFLTLKNSDSPVLEGA
jgi:polysaccharide transporter, PST family